jgi:hypothetical protein
MNESVILAGVGYLQDLRSDLHSQDRLRLRGSCLLPPELLLESGDRSSQELRQVGRHILPVTQLSDQP